MDEPITIDGSMGEGGGQVLRTSLALSMSTGKPFRIVNIRARRKHGGLLRQHLTALNAAAEVSRARVDGAVPGSVEVTFEPRNVLPGSYRFSVGTAGSATLVLQTVLPALATASAKSRLVLEGGTHNPWAPPFDFLERTFIPFLKRMGPDVSCQLERPGFYPAGGGRFIVEVSPVAMLSRVSLLDRGAIRRSGCRAVVAHLDMNIGHREVGAVCRGLAWSPNCGEVTACPESTGPGNVLIVAIESEHITEIFTGFGVRGVPAERVAAGTVEEVRRYLAAGVPVGMHLADQIVPLLALAGGGSFRTVAPSPHTITNIDVIERFLDVRIECKRVADDIWEITVERAHGFDSGVQG